MIELCHLQKQYAESMPLRDVSVTIHQGDVIAVIGPSGCGKSTLLRCVNMLDPPTGGKIFLDGEEITARGYNTNKLRLKIGMVFQSFNLFPHQTVIENIMRPQMKLLGRSKQEAYDKAYGLLAVVGLAQKQFQFPGQLSGGQQQRVAIARALALDPEILLLDEPTSALDPMMVSEVETVIYDLAKRGTTMMLVTHDMKFARSVSNRVFYLDEGGIYEEGTPEQIFSHPQKEKTRRFIRSLSSLDIDIDSKAFDYPKAIAGIERFATRQGFDIRMTYKLQMVFEELCAIYLPSKAADGFRAAVSFEYAEQSGSVSLKVKHNAGVISEDDRREDLSFAIISRLSEDFRQTKLEAPWTQLCLTIRKGAYHG